MKLQISVLVMTTMIFATGVQAGSFKNSKLEVRALLNAPIFSSKNALNFGEIQSIKRSEVAPHEATEYTVITENCAFVARVNGTGLPVEQGTFTAFQVEILQSNCLQ